jgi:hypothetical protein
VHDAVVFLGLSSKGRTRQPNSYKNGNRKPYLHHD